MSNGNAAPARAAILEGAREGAFVALMLPVHAQLANLSLEA